MNVLFKQACIINGKMFALGQTCEVPADVKNDSYFHDLMKEELIVEVGNEPPHRLESFQERNERLAKKLMPKEEAPQASVEQANEILTEASDDNQSEEPKKKSKKK